MADISTITGVQQIIANIAKAKSNMEKGFVDGLKLAGLKLQRESQQLVPVNFGVLKSSAYTRARGQGFTTIIRVGYTAGYALFVHELVAMKLKGLPRPHKRGFYWDPAGRGQAKFLEEPAKRLAPELRKTILDSMKI